MQKRSHTAELSLMVIIRPGSRPWPSTSGSGTRTIPSRLATTRAPQWTRWPRWMSTKASWNGSVKIGSKWILLTRPSGPCLRVTLFSLPTSFTVSSIENALSIPLSAEYLRFGRISRTYVPHGYVWVQGLNSSEPIFKQSRDNDDGERKYNSFLRPFNYRLAYSLFSRLKSQLGMSNFSNTAIYCWIYLDTHQKQKTW